MREGSSWKKARVTFIHTARNMGFDLVATRCDTKHAAIFYIKSIWNLLCALGAPKADFVFHQKRQRYRIFYTQERRFFRDTISRVLHTWQILPWSEPAAWREFIFVGLVGACYHIQIQLRAWVEQQRDHASWLSFAFSFRMRRLQPINTSQCWKKYCSKFKTTDFPVKNKKIGFYAK